MTTTRSGLILITIGDRTCGKVCNSTQANDWKCFSSPAVPQVTLKRLNDRLICVKRGSLTSVDRPAVKDNSCPDGYRLCSSSGFSSVFRGLQDTTSSVCQKTNEPCPVTGITISSNNNITLTRGGDAASVGLPIVGLELTRGRPCKFPSGSSETYYFLFGQLSMKYFLYFPSLKISQYLYYAIPVISILQDPNSFEKFL